VSRGALSRQSVFGLIFAIGLMASPVAADPVEVGVTEFSYWPAVLYQTPIRKLGRANFNLAAAKLKEPSQKLEVLVAFTYLYDDDEWKDFYAARMWWGSIELPFKADSRAKADCTPEGRCKRSEQASIVITIDQLREASRRDLDITVSAKRGNEAIIKIDAADALALMKAVGIE